ncbi:uncharacterized protein LOC114537698 [Dendronephthya gigantea]|uniref:uncharacterized protein LOC114537698 n=1 Tax=Dendronephthya gigantea TaxID=151771 RepID=UPI00106D27A2|nr:uncharacterized protein LOC114537698 [Dendronephthya gigantea]
MILHNDVMADRLNVDATSNIKAVSSLVNHRLKLPPIATGYNNAGKHHNNRSLSYGNRDLKTGQDFSLPRINLNALVGSENDVDNGTGPGNKSLENQMLTFPRVYTVLPPIGKTFDASSSLKTTTVNIPNAPVNGTKRHRRSTRARRNKKLQENPELKHDLTETLGDISKSETVVEQPAVLIKTTVADSQNGEKFSLQIPDPALPSVKIDVAETDRETRLRRSETLKSDSGKGPVTLGTDSIYATITVPETNDDFNNEDNRQEAESPFPQFSTVPEALRLYADVYPPSPPSSARRGKIAVEKTRQLLVEENGLRISFMENFGIRRRNATCVELDDALKNAVQLLRDLFLRKTMEELCMLW